MSWISKLLQKVFKRKPQSDLLIVRDTPLGRMVEYQGELSQTDRNILDIALKNPADLHPSVALSAGIETHAMILRQRADGMLQRMEDFEAMDGGTAPVDGRIAKTDDEYANRVLPSLGKTEAQIDAWNSLMQNGGRVMYMGKGKTYVEVNERMDPKPVIDVGLEEPKEKLARIDELSAGLLNAHEEMFGEHLDQIVKEEMEKIHGKGLEIEGGEEGEDRNADKYHPPSKADVDTHIHRIMMTEISDEEFRAEMQTEFNARQLKLWAQNPFPRSIQDQLPSLEEQPLASPPIDEPGKD